MILHEFVIFEIDDSELVEAWQSDDWNTHSPIRAAHIKKYDKILQAAETQVAK